MRLHPGTALVVYLCLWIPVAHANQATEDQDASGDDDQNEAPEDQDASGDDQNEAPEDQDASGDDDEFSASGSGDGDLWIDEPVKTTQASPNTTEAAWFTTDPHESSKRATFRPFILRDNMPKTFDHITEAFLPHTTAITETEPTPVITIRYFNPLGKEGEATTVSNEEQPETTQPPAVEPPVVPTSKEEFTTAVSEEERTTEPSNKESEEKVHVFYEESKPVATEAPDMETTPLVLSTTSDGNLEDTEASGDLVEFTTVETNFIEDTISNKGEPVESEQPTLTDLGFLDNEIKPRSQPGTGSDSEYARGNASDDDSLLERKEVLAGVIAGGVVGLAFAIMLVSLMVYRMKKKDEGSYSLDEHKHPNGGYQKPQKQEEFLA